VEPVTKPVRSVGNFFKKLTGKEVEPEKELTERDVKNLEVLDELVAKEKEQRKAKDEAWKRRKKEMKESKKQLISQQKKQKKGQDDSALLLTGEVEEETAPTVYEV
jgi:hypothetical protein